MDDIERALAEALRDLFAPEFLPGGRYEHNSNEWPATAAAIRQHPAVVAALEAMRAEERGNRIEQVRRKRVGAVVARDREAALRARVERLEAALRAVVAAWEADWNEPPQTQMADLLDPLVAARAALGSGEAER